MSTVITYLGAFFLESSPLPKSASTCDQWHQTGTTQSRKFMDLCSWVKGTAVSSFLLLGTRLCSLENPVADFGPDVFVRDCLFALF